MLLPSIDCERFHRRDFLRLGSLGLLGLPDLLRLEALAADKAENPATAKSVIMIWLAGGPSTIDMWDLKPDAPQNIRGPFKPIDTNVTDIKISERLPQMAQVMDKCTIVRSLAHSIPAHGPATVFMNTGHKPNPALNYPSLGSIAARLLPTSDDIPPYFIFGGNRNGGALAGYLGPAYNPFEVQGNGRGQLRVRGVSLPADVSLSDLDDRTRLLETFDYRFAALEKASDVVAGLNQFQQKAIDILRSDRTKKAFDLDEESTAVRQRFGLDGFGQGALAARRLVQAGVRFVTLGTGGWDTHGNNFNTLQNRLLPPVDRTLSALIADLEDKGLLASTIVYCVGEFGRTPRINNNSGRDHWARSMAVLVAGGGFPSGKVYGSTDADGTAPEDNPCTPDDLSATIVRLLGLDPKHELSTPSGRPVPLFREGTPLMDLLG